MPATHDRVIGPGGKTLASGGIDRNVSLWDVGKMLETHTMK
jgi:WD40 repeat protein